MLIKSVLASLAVAAMAASTTPASPGDAGTSKPMVVQRTPTSVVVDGTLLRGPSDGRITRVSKTPDGDAALVSTATSSSSGGLPTLTTRATRDEVSLTWDKLPGNGEFSVYRDGKFLSAATGSSFVDDTVAAGLTYKYAVDTSVPRDSVDSSKTYDRGWAAPVTEDSGPGFGKNAYRPGVGISEKDQTKNESIMMGALVGTPVTNSVSAVRSLLARQQAAVAAASGSQVEYKTFIPTATAPGFPCAFRGQYFGGDNRSYSIFLDRYRTKIAVNIDWTNNGALTVTKRASNTVRYFDDGTLDEVRNAGTAGMKVTTISSNSAQDRFSVDHDAGNPFCVTGSINYKYDALVYRAGYYTIKGDYRPAPNHEMYIRQDGAGWTTLINRDSKGFSCLTGICGREAIDVSK